MTTRVLDCSVTIGGVDFSSYVVSLNRDHFLCRPVGTATIGLDPENAPDCDPGAAVSISEMGVLRFSGYVSSVSKERFPVRYEVTCQDELKKLVEYGFVDEELTADGETVTYWIHQFLNRVGIVNRVVAETVDTVPPGITFRMESAMDIVRKLCNTQGWQMYAGVDGTVYVGDFLIPGTAQNITNYTEAVDLSDDSWLRNEVTVFGSSSVKTTITASIPQLGTETRAAVLANPYIRTQLQADAIASQMMGYFDTPLDTKEIAMEGGERATFLLDDIGVSDGYMGSIAGQVTGVESQFDQSGYVPRHHLNERCPGFWAMSSGSAIGNCFIGHKSAGVYKYNYVNDTATLKNAGLSGTALQCHDLKVDPHFYGDGRRRVWRVTAGGVYKSEDDAETWESISFPAPVNAAGDSPAPTVGDLTFYGMAFDQVLRGVIHVLAGYISPNDRLWLYTSKNSGDSWTSCAFHGHSNLEGGWTKHWNTNGLADLVYFNGDLYMCRIGDITGYYDTSVYRYDGGGGAPVEVVDVTEGAGWPTEGITGLVACETLLWAISSHIFGTIPPGTRKVTAHWTENGTDWYKALDTNTGLGLGVTWDYAQSYGGVDADTTALFAITRSEDVGWEPGPFHSYVIGCDWLGNWFADFVGDNAYETPDYIRAFGKSQPAWYPAGPALIWMRDSEDNTYWRNWNGSWSLMDTNSIGWGYRGFGSHNFEDRLYAVDFDDDNHLKRCKDGFTWETIVDDDGCHGLGVFERRLFYGSAGDVFVQTLPGYFECDHDEATPSDFQTPTKFAEAWNKFWCVTDTGLWYRNNQKPSWAMNMRRSALANQGHQCSLATLPNVPWIVYISAARESGGDEYIRLLRLYTDSYDSMLSHTFTSGSAIGRTGFVRVNAPPTSGSASGEIVYAFGYGADDPVSPTSNELVWRFESGEYPADKTDTDWAGYLLDAVQALIHNGDDQDWVALFNLGSARGTQNGGDDWTDLTSVGVTVDGADRANNAIVSGLYSGGANMVRYSPDRASTWNQQGTGVSTADGIASVQIYDKTRLR